MQAKKKICAKCQQERYIWVTRGKDRYCKSCAARLEPAKPTMPRKPISPRSPKKVKLDAAYSIIRKAYLDRHPVCEAAIPGVCSGKRPDQVHHRAGKTGDLYLDDRFFLAVDFACHRWIEENPSAAKELGLSETRIDK